MCTFRRILTKFFCILIFLSAPINLHASQQKRGLYTLPNETLWEILKHAKNHSESLKMYLQLIYTSKTMCQKCRSKESKKIKQQLVNTIIAKHKKSTYTLFSAINAHDITTVDILLSCNVATLDDRKVSKITLDDIGSAEYSMSPLYFAATSLHTGAKMATYLIQRGANIHGANEFGTTALHAAATCRNKEVAELLIERGAHVNVKDLYREQTPLHYAACSTVKSFKKLTVNDERVTKLPDGKVIPKRKTIADFLIEKGALIDAKDKYNVTPLHIAATANNIEVAKILIKKGCDINAKDIDGSTPLHYAFYHASYRTAKLLRQKGADCNSKNNRGFTPSDLADDNKKSVFL